MKTKALPTKIVTKEEKLRDHCQNFTFSEFDEAVNIGNHLLSLCKKLKGAGLAANQIGICRRVCVVNIKEPIILINPFIVWSSLNMTDQIEYCLSFPNKPVKTRRHKSVKVAYVDKNKKTLTRTFGPTLSDDNDLLESICVQHELGHLDSKLHFDFAVENFL